MQKESVKEKEFMSYRENNDPNDPNESQEDWGESFDDMDAGDWQDHLGGPDDDFFEGRW